MSDFQLTTPVAFIIFNRPDTTERVFAEIAKAKPPKLFVIADGPRANKLGEAEKCTATREIIKKVDWDCQVFTNYSEINLGCKIRVSSGIDWVFEQVPEVIILEDDCLPEPTFFRFCEHSLNRYRDNPNVMLICGTNLADTAELSSSYYYATNPHIWGWASWRSVWEDYDVNMNALPKLKKDQAFRESLTKKNWNYWIRFFEDVASGKINTWDVQVTFLALSTRRLSVFPKQNLISNIGFREDATHTTRNSHLADLQTFPFDEKFIAPAFMLPLLSAEKQRYKKEGVGTLRWIRAIKFILTKEGITYSVNRLAKILKNYLKFI